MGRDRFGMWSGADRAGKPEDNQGVAAAPGQSVPDAPAPSTLGHMVRGEPMGNGPKSNQDHDR